jgi:hypothetical protein
MHVAVSINAVSNPQYICMRIATAPLLFDRQFYILATAFVT